MDVVPATEGPAPDGTAAGRVRALNPGLVRSSCSFNPPERAQRETRVAGPESPAARGVSVFALTYYAGRVAVLSVNCVLVRDSVADEFSVRPVLCRAPVPVLRSLFRTSARVPL